MAHPVPLFDHPTDGLGGRLRNGSTADGRQRVLRKLKGSASLTFGNSIDRDMSKSNELLEYDTFVRVYVGSSVVHMVLGVAHAITGGRYPK